ncbi:MAG: hypothetical protein NTY45_00210, partial [Elusimicrobia bacterium]|nr:hypothetical protein [Elusimicrobiota bacterium]
MTRAVKLLPVLLLLSGAAYAAECPAKAQPGAIAAENADDCPWAGAARLLGGAAGQKESLEAVFAAQAPGILKQLDADRSSPVLQLWGESINYDELANGVIVNPTIL